MAAPADPSLLSAELEADDGEDEALRRLLLQVTQDDEEPSPPTGPSRAVTPQPGFCVKTRAGGAKVFINVCHSGEVPAPPPLSPPGLRRLLLRDPPGAFRIPMSLGEPHAELDRGGQGCTAYDVVVNSEFFRTLQADPLYREFFLTVAMEGLSEKLAGAAKPPVLGLHLCPKHPDAAPTPHPGARGAGAESLWLGLSEERLVLKEEGGGPALLELGLPHPPDPARCHACFHRGTKVLTVTMPLQA
ncbi:PIH1 domain-containing protein 1 isoform X2 [Patagioenas fasciata]|uniref:PIH1 domain-containing protein 1 isoform X2 n=1 Tax=Patagioenas fasciata TaxID=372321 RepID=UPI003A99739E